MPDTNVDWVYEPGVVIPRSGYNEDEEGRRGLESFTRNKAWTKPGVRNFFTDLSPGEETRFQAWVKANKVPVDDSPHADYDMRGFWKALQARDPKAVSAVDPNDKQLHYPDYWKTPYHETFSNESKFADPTKAPKWNDKDQLVAPGGKVLFDDRARNQPLSSPPKSEPSPLPVAAPQSHGLDDWIVPEQQTKTLSPASETDDWIVPQEPPSRLAEIGRAGVQGYQEGFEGADPEFTPQQREKWGTPYAEPLVRSILAPLGVASGLYRGAQAAAIEAGVPRDIASIPDAFVGSPGMFRGPREPAPPGAATRGRVEPTVAREPPSEAPSPPTESPAPEGGPAPTTPRLGYDRGIEGEVIPPETGEQVPATRAPGPTIEGERGEERLSAPSPAGPESTPQQTPLASEAASEPPTQAPEGQRALSAPSPGPESIQAHGGPWLPKGTNGSGEQVFENPNGVRAIMEDGNIPSSEPTVETENGLEPKAKGKRKPRFEIEKKPEEPKPKQPEKPPETAEKPAEPPPEWTSAGKNAYGQEVFTNPHGVHSVVENGIREVEPVRMRPTRGGMETRVPSPEDKDPRFKVVPEASVESASEVERPAHWLNGMQDSERQRVYTQMRAVDKEMDPYYNSPSQGGQGISVGGQGFDDMMAAEVRREFLKALRGGQTPEEAANTVKELNHESVMKHNEQRPKDINWKRSPNSYDNIADLMVVKFKHLPDATADSTPLETSPDQGAKPEAPAEPPKAEETTEQSDGYDVTDASGKVIGAAVPHPRQEGMWMAMWKATDPRDAGMKRYKTRRGAIAKVHEVEKARAIAETAKEVARMREKKRATLEKEYMDGGMSKGEASIKALFELDKEAAKTKESP